MVGKKGRRLLVAGGIGIDTIVHSRRAAAGKGRFDARAGRIESFMTVCEFSALATRYGALSGGFGHKRT